MATATLETVTAATICAPKPSKFKGGNYVSVCFGFSDNTEKWVTYDEGAPELDWIHRGQKYQATVEKDKITKIERLPAQPAQPPTSQPGPAPTQPALASPPAPPTLEEETLQAAAAYINTLARLYGHCYGQVSVNLERYDAPDAAIQSAATTLFISVTRKFNL